MFPDNVQHYEFLEAKMKVCLAKVTIIGKSPYLTSPQSINVMSFCRRGSAPYQVKPNGHIGKRFTCPHVSRLQYLTLSASRGEGEISEEIFLRLLKVSKFLSCFLAGSMLGIDPSLPPGPCNSIRSECIMPRQYHQVKDSKLLVHEAIYIYIYR